MTNDDTNTPTVVTIEPATCEASPASSNLAQLRYVFANPRVVPAGVTVDALAGEDVWILEVTFRNGSRYRYLGVPQAHFGSIVNAESPGRAFNALVRGQYPAQIWCPVCAEGGAPWHVPPAHIRPILGPLDASA